MHSGLFEAFLAKNGVVILDGAMATELEKRGANLKHDLWSAKLLIENPDLIKQVHLDYLKAGADIITTASYQASFAGFNRKGYNPEKSRELLLLASELAIRAREEAMRMKWVKGPRPLIAASVGPYGASLADGSEYRGNYGLTVEELMTFHRERMRILLQSDVDLLACETIPCPEEAMALIGLLKEFPGAKAWLSFSCKNETSVCNGSDFARCAAMANDSEQVVAVGVNCTAPQFVSPLIQKAVPVCHKPIIVYPNKGEYWDAVSKCWIPGNEQQDFAEYARNWFESGAKIIGGCCRTSPEDIMNLKKMFPGKPEE
ncbi:MAG TPA: homocysteine S-methyltransferase [Puia sp.]